MTPGDPIQLFQRPFPSANMILVHGPRPILIDSGFGSDLPDTLRLLHSATVPPDALALVANTHYHSDHVGGNHHLQTAHGVPIAASAHEAALINGRDPDACSAHFLNQPVEPYTVNRLLADGDELSTGTVTLQVLATPGHSKGHLSFYAPEQRVLFVGDVLHGDDVAWLNLFTEGPDPMGDMLASLDRLAELPVDWACSGHGAPMLDFAAAIDQARRRYAKWQADPEKIGWHACKRILGFALMLEEGMTPERLEAYLLESPWFVRYGRGLFRLEPQDFIAPLLAEMLRSGAALWREGRLMSATPYTKLPPGWLGQSGMRPVEWPKNRA